MTSTLVNGMFPGEKVAIYGTTRAKTRLCLCLKISGFKVWTNAIVQNIVLAYSRAIGVPTSILPLAGS